MSGSVSSGSFGELDARLLYRILGLRIAVFSVEQECVYNDLDGRDLEPGTVHLWVEEDPSGPTVAGCARVLVEPDGARIIGRVVTAAAARHRGVGGSLMDAAVALVPPGAPARLNAQSRLEAWYGRWGFVRTGPDFEEDGIWHVPMQR